MFDAHIRAWKKHLERTEMRALLAAKFRVTEDWRMKWGEIDRRTRDYRERKWLT